MEFMECAGFQNRAINWDSRDVAAISVQSARIFYNFRAIGEITEIITGRD